MEVGPFTMALFWALVLLLVAVVGLALIVLACFALGFGWFKRKPKDAAPDA